MVFNQLKKLIDINKKKDPLSEQNYFLDNYFTEYLREEKGKYNIAKQIFCGFENYVFFSTDKRS